MEKFWMTQPLDGTVVEPWWRPSWRHFFPNDWLLGWVSRAFFTITYLFHSYAILPWLSIPCIAFTTSIFFTFALAILFSFPPLSRISEKMVPFFNGIVAAASHNAEQSTPLSSHCVKVIWIKFFGFSIYHYHDWLPKREIQPLYGFHAEMVKRNLSR